MAGRYDEACEDIELFLTNKIKNYDSIAQPVTPSMVETYYKKFAPLHPYYENQMSGKQMAFVNCAVDFRRRELLMGGRTLVRHQAFRH